MYIMIIIILTSLLVFGNLLPCFAGQNKSVNIELIVQFGEKDLPEDYILGSPSGLAVDNVGNILITDDYKLKVYTPDGKPKMVLGGKGQGPEEYVGANMPTVGPMGYVNVLNGSRAIIYYDSSFEFIHSRKMIFEDYMKEYSRSINLTNPRLTRVVSVGNNVKMIDLFAVDHNIEGIFPKYDVLLMLKGEKITEIVKYHSKNNVLFGRNNNTTVPFMGELYWQVFDKRKVVYTHSLYETLTHFQTQSEAQSSNRVTLDGKSFYNLIIIDLNTMEKEIIEIEYELTKIPTQLKKFGTGWAGLEAKERVLKDVEFYPPIQKFLVDNVTKMAYAFTYITNLDDQILTQIIELSSAKKINEVYFPFIPNVIKNGKLYYLNKPQDKFPVVEVYQINN